MSHEEGRGRLLTAGRGAMSDRYQKPFTIPDGFPVLLKQFAREVLRAQVRPRARPPPARHSATQHALGPGDPAGAGAAR